MIQRLAAALFAGLIAGAAAAPAQAWERSSSTTTRAGTSEHVGSGSCEGGTCSRSSSTTGPRGNSAASSGSVSRDADGSGWNSTSQATGPRGGSASRSGSGSYTPPK